MLFLTWLSEHWSQITADTVTFIYAVEKAGGLRTIAGKFIGPNQSGGEEPAPSVTVQPTVTTKTSTPKTK